MHDSFDSSHNDERANDDDFNSTHDSFASMQLDDVRQRTYSSSTMWDNPAELADVVAFTLQLHSSFADDSSFLDTALSDVASVGEPVRCSSAASIVGAADRNDSYDVFSDDEDNIFNEVDVNGVRVTAASVLTWLQQMCKCR
jgi:hypothetical protein